MNKKLLLLFIPFLLSGCNSAEGVDSESHDTHTIVQPTHSGAIGSFDLLGPDNSFVTDSGFTFTWEDADNADYYQIEIASTEGFVRGDEDEVYLRENNLSNNKYELRFILPKKDIKYYWRVTAFNKDYEKKCNETYRQFFYEAKDVGELEIEIEDAQDWVLHKEGSYADISIDRSNFFNNNKNSLSIVFDKEHTSQGVPKSDGWIVVTKTEDRELYGTDAFYFNFYYSGHDATVLVRVLDYDGEYWHKQIQISNNSKQTILVKYDEFELRTAGTNIFNRKFDWEHIRYFEIVFERTFGDGICLFSDIKAVKFENYKHMFMDKMDFRSTDMSEWTYENYNFDKTISEDGSELTLGFSSGIGYGFQNANVYKFFVGGDALRMQVKYTGADLGSTFYFRVLEEDSDRWQFKVPFTYLIKDDYKEIIIPLKAFQRTDYMSGDGAKQFYFIQKFNIGLANNYSKGTLSVKDIEVVKISDVVPSHTRVVTPEGLIEDFNDYNLYTEIYYQWEQSVVNKDEAMKLDNVHKVGGINNPYCAEFDYKADMEQAVYQLYLDTENVPESLNAFSIWIRDASNKFADPAVEYLDDEDVAAEITIQLTMDSGEWYRYTIDKAKKEWYNYVIAFKDFTLFNEDSLLDDPNPLKANKIIHMALGFKYLYYDQQGNHHPTYAIANPVYLDEMYFITASESVVTELPGTIKADADNDKVVTVDTLETYQTNEEIFGYWYYEQALEQNLMELSDDVSSEGGEKSLKLSYKGSIPLGTLAYARNTMFHKSVEVKCLVIDIKGDGKADTVVLNLNWRKGGKNHMMRYKIYNVPEEWTRYEIGLELFQVLNETDFNDTISKDTSKAIESISIAALNSFDKEAKGDIFIDNIRLVSNLGYTRFEEYPID